MIDLVEQLQASDFDRHFGVGNSITLRAVEQAFIEAIEQIIGDEPVKFDRSMTLEEKDRLFAQNRQQQVKEQERRLDELGNEVSPLHAGAVLHLFSRLEFIAGTVIRPLLALVRTVDPARIKEQCPWLPGSLVHDAEASLLDALKEEKRKGGRSKGLPAEKLAEFQQCYVEWLAKGGRRHGTYGDFDNRMSEKFGRSAKVMANYRKNLESPDTRSEGDRD